VTLVADATRAAHGTTTVGGCEYPFTEGERYLVYAYAEEGGLQTSYCARTKKLAEADKDLKALGRGKRHAAGS
jgi:hypothetical protein